MAIFVITYDLRGQGKKFDYAPLVQELRTQKCFQIQAATWLGSFANNATQVHNHFKKLMDGGDSLLVNELYQHFAYTGRAKQIAKWLELNPPTPLQGDKGDAGIARAQAEQAAAAPAAQPAAKKTVAKKKSKYRA
jgi:hypothetical protein